jgi:hypothetical protein
MADYKRLVSYIYSYSGGVRGKNAGFVKAEVRGGQFKLAVSLKGVYTDTPELFGVYFMVDRDKNNGSTTLLKIGNVMINQGLGQYQDILNPENINSSGYTFSDISAVAVTRPNDSFYMLCSLWEDFELNTEKLEFREEGYKKPETVQENVKPAESAEKMKAGKEASKIKQDRASEKSEKVQQDRDGELRKAPAENTEVHKEAVPEKAEEQTEKKVTATESQTEDDGFSWIFENADNVDAFDDDYFYDCIEVSPEQLKRLPIDENVIANNSFLIHGYYNFRHVLFGRVRENDNNTKYFIGIPGMYCNRERFMASMFGFGNFKKSHRADYSNPYFGYWYQEM